MLVVRVEPVVLAKPGEYLAGIGYALGAAFLYAICSIVTKQLKGTPPHLIALLHVALRESWCVAPFVDFRHLPSTPNHWADLRRARRGRTPTTMYVLLYGAIQKLPTAVIGALSFIYPVVAIICQGSGSRSDNA